MKHKIILVFIALIISFTAYSAPARRGPVYLVQPDGTSFEARIRGDEFMKIITTKDGSAIIQDEDSWWCYAFYDAEGGKHSSGQRVGHDVSAKIKAAGREIPYEKLSANAQMKRSPVSRTEEPLLTRVRKAHGIATKGDDGPVTKHGLVILAQFKDKKFKYTQTDFKDMLTKAGYSHNGATGSAKEYFDAQFNGTFDFSFEVSPIVTLQNNMRYYGQNDKEGYDLRPEQMIIDACTAADEDIDFSLYDDDNDGVVDNVFVFFAGGDEAEGVGDDCIWSHAYYIYSGAGKELFLDGKMIDRYACTSELTRIYRSMSSYTDELAGIGTFCHEYFHTFDLPDMYDTDYEGSGGQSGALWGSTSLMDSGNQNNNGNTPPYLNAMEREILGISEPEVIEANGGYSFAPIHKNGKCYRLNTDNADEYYLLEYRSEEGWDKYAGGHGMLIYHVDKSDRSSGYSESYDMNLTAEERWGDYNEVNCRPDRQCADLIEADGRPDEYAYSDDDTYYSYLDNTRGLFFPYSGVNSLQPDSNPGLSFWSGGKSVISITNIKEEDGKVTFNVLGFEDNGQKPVVLPPNVASIKAEAFMDAAIIQFESDKEYEGAATVKWKEETGGESMEISVSPYDAGKYSFTLEGLKSDMTYTVRICFESDGLTGEEKSKSFMTKKKPVVDWPFIYMRGVKKNSDGTLPAGSKLPLRLHNAGDAAAIEWFFNDEPAVKGGDGYLIVDKSGILKAVINWEDGSGETIIKEIIIGGQE